jgi:hypothetical protein
MELIGYIHHSLGSELGETLNLGKTGFSLLKRDQKIHLEHNLSPASGQLYLVPKGLEFRETNSGQTHSEECDGSVVVFRAPGQIKISFHLYSGEFNRNDLLNLAEKLGQAFFDKKSLKAYIPSSFEKYPGLFSLMKNQKGQLLIESFGFNKECNALDVRLTYLGPYHSGNYLRKDRRVEKRDIRISP